MAKPSAPSLGLGRVKKNTTSVRNEVRAQLQGYSPIGPIFEIIFVFHDLLLILSYEE